MDTDNRYYIVRSVDAGVYFGQIKERSEGEVTMTDTRNLWYWEGAASLMQLATEGVKMPQRCKFTVSVSEITILGVCEIIPCTDEAIKCIRSVPTWKMQTSLQP